VKVLFVLGEEYVLYYPNSLSHIKQIKYCNLKRISFIFNLVNMLIFISFLFFFA